MPTSERQRLIDSVAETIGQRPADDSAVLFEFGPWVLVEALPSSGWLTSDAPSIFLMSRALFQSPALAKSTTVITSSRLAKNLQPYRAWFDAVRTIGVRLNPENHSLITSATTASFPYVRRIAEIFGIDLIECQRLEVKDLTNFRDVQATVIPDHAQVYFLSDSTSTPKNKSIDFDLVERARNVYALSVSAGGNIFKAIENRLKDASQADRAASTWLLNCPELTKPKTKQALLERGAIDWLLLPDELGNAVGETDDTHDSHKQTALSRLPPMQRGSAKIHTIPLSSIDQSKFLLHWARAPAGPWPDQAASAHIDRLLFGVVETRFRSVATLCRIMASQRLLATSTLTRAETPVVCFSEVPVGRLMEKTIFRRHLARWDFVPYGVAIKREVLKTLGCQPVVYGDDETWQSMDGDQKPWFQLANSSDGKIDWTEEQEWRLVGDLDLTRIGSDDAFAFVKSIDDARLLSEICIWPIVILDVDSEVPETAKKAEH